MFSFRILEFGRKFKGRLDDLWLESALDYINYNEWGLAFDTLCAYLVEYDVSLCSQEYEEMMQLAVDMGLDSNDVNFKYLEKLVKSIDE